MQVKAPADNSDKEVVVCLYAAALTSRWIIELILHISLRLRAVIRGVMIMRSALNINEDLQASAAALVFVCCSLTVIIINHGQKKCV